MRRAQDRRATVIAAVVEQSWQRKLLYTPSGPIEVFLHLGTGWVLSPVVEGWIATHSITAAIVRGTETGARVFGCERPRVFADKTEAMLELERLCPDCYAVDWVKAPCESCEGTGKLGPK